MSDSIQTAVVTGASRGFGRAIAATLVAAGNRVVGIARTGSDLAEVRAELGDRFIPVTGDATDEALAEQVIRDHRPGLLVLNAGARPHLAALPEQTWESFSTNWHTDTRHAFTWMRAALLAPLAPGSTVLAVSSGAALNGSPLSGGYAGAKATIRFLRTYAADESDRATLGLRFLALLPRLTPVTGLGTEAVAGYAARSGIDVETFLATQQPVLTADQVAKAVLELTTDPASSGEYLVSAAGIKPLA